MPFLTTGITTGLLGYTLRREFLGEGLPYREVEVYDYEFYSTQLTGTTPYTDIETNIKSYFAGASGNVNVKILESPAEYFFPNDHTRVGKFIVEVENRRAITGLTGDLAELSGNYYKGFDAGFFNNYATLFNDFKEEFNFSNGENGNDTFEHSLSFTLQSGGKPKASEIASYVFASDKDTTFGISAMIGGVTVADSGSFINFFTETYDLVKNNFSFSRRRELLPATGTAYYYNLNHSLDFKQDGTIDVTERGNIQGKATFDQASQGFFDLSGQAYSRCNTLYNSFKNTLAGATVTESLAPIPLVITRSLIKPNISISYELGFTNNPNVNTGVIIDKILELERIDSKYINITHTYNFIVLSNPVYQNMDVDYINQLTLADAASPIEVTGYYTSSQFFNSQWPNMSRIKRAKTAPNRKKNASASFVYTNNPIYFNQLTNYIYPILECKVGDTKPVDIVTEYKIINRPNKQSLINYAYQTEKGEKSATVSARLQRTASNVFTSPPNVVQNLSALYTYGIAAIMSSFIGLNPVSFTYFLSNVRYRVTSDNEIDLDLGVSYTIKKYNP